MEFTVNSERQVWVVCTEEMGWYPVQEYFFDTKEEAEKFASEIDGDDEVCIWVEERLTYDNQS